MDQKGRFWYSRYQGTIEVGNILNTSFWKEAMLCSTSSMLDDLHLGTKNGLGDVWLKSSTAESHFLHLLPNTPSPK